jgi:endonuclease YncB( thermonuclease family)
MYTPFGSWKSINCEEQQMKKSLIALAGVMAILTFLSPQAFSADRFKITRVYDGDTVQAESPGVVIYIMLVGIDAPEVANEVNGKGQPYGTQAKNFLTSMILNRTVDVVGYGTAPYPNDKIIGVIYLHGEDVNLEMVKRGLAEVQESDLPKGLDIRPYVEAEKEARARKVGMWSLGDRYMSPKEWRRLHAHVKTNAGFN